MTRSFLAIGAVTAFLLLSASLAPADLSLPDGTVTAHTYYSGHGLNAYWAESVTTLTIDAENLSPGQYLQVCGKITDITTTNPTATWLEVGLIPKNRWDYWQTAFGGGWRPAVFNKGLYVVHWHDGSDLGLSLKEGWDNWTDTSYYNNNGPYAYPLASPTVASPWEFAFTMDPNPSPNESNLSVVGATMYGTQPFLYGPGVDAGNPYPNDNDYSQCYLIAQIWSSAQDAAFSFEDVRVTVVPAPGAALLGARGLGLLGWIKRRRLV